MKKLAIGKFATVAQVSKWDIEVDQDSIAEGTVLTRTWYREGEKEGERVPETDKMSAGEYTTEAGERILVDSDGIVRMIFKNESKMKKVSKLKTLLAAFKEALNGEEQEQEFTEVTLEDGTVIVYEGELAVGVAVMSKTEDEEVSLADGTYTITDGATFTVAGGLVTEIEEVEDPEGGEENEFNADTFKKEISEMLDEKISALKTELSEEFSKVDTKDIEEKFSKLQKDLSEMSEATIEAVVELSEAKPSKKTPKEVKASKPSVERAVQMMQSIKNSKSKK